MLAARRADAGPAEEPANESRLAAVRVCLAYDCLFPWTVGGAERWLRSLAEELAAEGNDVTYLTRRQWPASTPPSIPGVKVIAVSREEELYGEDGARRSGEPLRYGLGVFRHLIRHRRSYDVVHVTVAPFFGLLGARAALLGSRVPLFADWDEAWTPDYWREYAGPIRGRIGTLVQWLCVKASRRGFVESRLHADRLREIGFSGELTLLPGLYDGPESIEPRGPAQPPMVVFAGRHIPEKRVLSIPSAIVEARRGVPELRATIIGDGPDRERLLEEIARLKAGEFISAPGFVDFNRVLDEISQAACLLLPSSREGYGIVVMEAAARATPVVLVAGPDNAATELVEEGVNGFIAPDDSPSGLATAILKAVDGGQELRASTSEWFAMRSQSASAAASARLVGRKHREALNQA